MIVADSAGQGKVLRPYQQDLLERLVAAPAPAMCQAPTGAGKTEIGCALVQAMDAPALVIVHRRELVEQWQLRLAQWGVEDSALVKTIQSMIRVKTHPTYGRKLVVLDEAHRYHDGAGKWAYWAREAGKAEDTRVYGLTATPYRLSRKEGFDKTWRSLTLGPSIPELVEQGALARTIVRTHPLIKGFGKDKGDYSTSATMSQLKMPVFTEAGVEWLVESGMRKALVYAVSRQHAENVTRALNDRGYAAAALLDNTEGGNAEARARIVQAFRDGELRALVNVAILTEGFDVPDADAVLMLRPTMSLGLYLQMAGRAMRPKPDGGYGYILDCTDNSERFEHPLMSELHWTLAPQGSGVAAPAPTKTCKECKAVNHAAVHNCDACGYAFGKQCGQCGRFRSWKDWRDVIQHCARCEKLRQSALAKAADRMTAWAERTDWLRRRREARTTERILRDIREKQATERMLRQEVGKQLHRLRMLEAYKEAERYENDRQAAIARTRERRLERERKAARDTEESDWAKAHPRKFVDAGIWRYPIDGTASFRSDRAQGDITIKLNAERTKAVLKSPDGWSAADVRRAARATMATIRNVHNTRDGVVFQTFPKVAEDDASNIALALCGYAATPTG